MASPVLAFVGAVIASASLATVLANRDVANWQDADLSLLWIILGIAAGVGAALVYAPSVKAHTPSPTSRPRQAIVVRPTERLAWVGSGRGRSFYAVSVFLLVGAVLLFISAPPGGLVMLLVAVVVAQFGGVRVVIGAKGVRVSGPLGVPYVTIPLERIVSAEALDVHPMSWGGWGYRGSLRFMHRAAWIVRSGPGIRLDLRDDRTFVVTVDGAEEAAAVVNGLLTSTPR